jgi:hypothetical protein
LFAGFFANDARQWHRAIGVIYGNEGPTRLEKNWKRTCKNPKLAQNQQQII